MDDDDEFLYGSAPLPENKHVSQLNSSERAQSSNGVVDYQEPQARATPEAGAQGGEEGEDEEVELGDESEDEDIEIIMDQPSRSIDFRHGPSSRPTGSRTASTLTPTQPKGPQPSLTTEYTPIQRGGVVNPVTQVPPPVQPQPQIPSVPSFAGLQPAPILQPGAQSHIQPQDTELRPQDESGVDPSSLPPVTAPPSHPSIDPTATGIFDGRSILDVDLDALSEKPWRRPGSDISDWFNYGFDEISWEAYCYRRRDLGELANVLKTNVINFSGMPEDQLSALPPEVRQMVMTGTTAMMNGGGPNAGLMPMMDMSGMMGPMGMGMGMGDMGMGNPMMQGGMMQDANQVQQGGVGVGVGVSVGNGTPEQVGGNVAMMQDGFNGQPGGGMMNMGMGGGEYGMQDQNTMAQQMYPAMEPQPPVAPAASTARGVAPAAYRGRVQGGRGRGFPGRGRGRGGMYAGDGVPPPVPVRPASPLPPGVPTGPRNQNKYKDRDGNAPAVDGLDYGGTNKDVGGRTPSGEPEDRGSSRKRRSSPNLDDGRGAKRR